MRTVWTILSFMCFMEAGAAAAFAWSLGSAGFPYWVWMVGLVAAAVACAEIASHKTARGD